MKRKIICRDWQSTHKALVELSSGLKEWLICVGGALEVSVKPLTRSLEQNNRLWAMLADISAQVDWHGKKLGAEDWKAVFTASLKSMNVVPNLDNTGFVVLGQSTSCMTVRDMTELMGLMEAFGAQNGVRFSAPDYLGEER